MTAEFPIIPAVVSDALHLLQKALGTEVLALATPQADGSYRIVECVGGSDRLSGPVVLPSVPEAVVTHLGAGVRAPSVWSLLCGHRPDFLISAEVSPVWRLIGAGMNDGNGDADQPKNEEVTAAVRVLGVLATGSHMAAQERRDYERLQTLIDHLPLPVILAEGNMMSAFANRPAIELLGLEHSTRSPAAISQAMTRFLQGVVESDRDALKGMNDVRQTAARVSVHDADTIWEAMTLRISTKSLSGQLWLFTDVTAARQQERLIMERQRADLVGRITGGIAHEFNNILSVVMGNAELVATPDMPPHKREKLADLIMSAAERGARIVDRLMAFGERRPMDEVVFDTMDAVDSIIPLLAETIGSRIRLDLRATGTQLAVRSDRTLFEDVVAHLVLNARDAIAGSGHIAISLMRTHPDRDLRSRLDLADTDMVVLRVADDGEGMSKDTMDRAFDPFFTTKNMALAQGLGLSVVQGFAGQNNGAVEIRSTPGSGTTVSVYLPAVDGISAP